MQTSQKTSAAFSCRMIRAIQGGDQSSSWASNLQAQIREIQQLILGEKAVSFAPPEIIPIRQDPRNPQNIRIVSSFGYHDSTLLGLASRYLAQRIDPFLSPSSVAFRIAKDRTAMASLQELQQFNAARNGKSLHVAEADIQSCFDVLPHDTIRRALADISQRMADQGLPLDPIIHVIVEAYLRCYSFPQSVLPVCPEAHEKWLSKELLQIHACPLAERIGIPQGGSLSGLLLNIVLDRADRAIEACSKTGGKPIHYRRYCDDSLIVTTDRDTCESAYSAYLCALRELRLPTHPPERPEPYVGPQKKQFWESKSKSPYAWGSDIEAGEFPWIGFLGFQFRYDMKARLRSKSIKMQMDKIRIMADQTIEMYNKAVSRGGPRKCILQLFRGKVMASAFGKGWTDRRKPAMRCWFAWAGQLRKWPYETAFLRRLDRYFHLQECRVKKAIGYVPKPRRRPRSVGRKDFSYFIQFQKATCSSAPETVPEYP